jgi:AAA family ATP:ADP antiporter
MALGRVSHFAFAKPGSEALYTVVPREEKYKSKSLLDTFVYRLGDQAGAEGVRALQGGVGPTGLPIAVLPACAAVAGVGLLLARAFGLRKATGGERARSMGDSTAGP